VVTAFVRNLTNEAIPSIYQVGAGNVAASAYEPPRTYGLRVGYEF
jgi:iron complex outermembrane receptor protein